MRVHTNAFKDEIGQSGRQISSKLYHYFNYNLITEDSDTLITEDNIELISEQSNPSEKELIDEELIYSIDIVRNGQLLQSLMKELDIELKYELRVGDVVNAQFGVLVNNDFEYLDYGNYIIYSKEYVAENQTWRYVCYDKMLYSMVQYKPLDLTYPCTIRDYLIALADRIGLNFVNASDEFTNYNQQILDELFEGQNITYRDILDKLSEITASNIFINDNDELELGYPKETNDTIDESYLKDVNVNFGEVFGPINKVAITETDGGYEYPAEDSSSIKANGLTQIDIVDNVFAFNGNSNTIAQNILNKLNGLTYYLNNFSSPGICYYDYLDLYNIQVGENIYKSILLNDEINISQGLGEQIFTEKLENSKKEKDNFTTSVINNKQVQFQINKQKGEISSKVEKDGVISAINQSAEQVSIDANKINMNGVINAINNNTTTTINGNKISTGTITANQVASDIITTSNFSAQTINADNITSGTLSADKISGGTIGASSIQLQGVSLGTNSSTIGGWSVSSTRLYSNSANVASSIYRNGNVIFGGNYGMIKFDTNPVRITTADKLLISDSYSANSMVTSNDTISVRAYSGTVHINSNYGVYAGSNRLDGSSSKNVKENIKLIKQKYINEIYNEVDKMPFYTYDYKEKYGDKNDFGFIIEDIENTCLRDVLKISQNQDDKNVKNYGTLELNKMNLLLIKELMKKNQQLEKRIEDLERKIK